MSYEYNNVPDDNLTPELKTEEIKKKNKNTKKNEFRICYESTYELIRAFSTELGRFFYPLLQFFRNSNKEEEIILKMEEAINKKKGYSNDSAKMILIEEEIYYPFFKLIWLNMTKIVVAFRDIYEKELIILIRFLYDGLIKKICKDICPPFYENEKDLMINLSLEGIKEAIRSFDISYRTNIITRLQYCIMTSVRNDIPDYYKKYLRKSKNKIIDKNNPEKEECIYIKTEENLNSDTYIVKNDLKKTELKKILIKQIKNEVSSLIMLLLEIRSLGKKEIWIFILGAIRDYSIENIILGLKRKFCNMTESQYEYSKTKILDIIKLRFPGFSQMRSIYINIYRNHPYIAELSVMFLLKEKISIKYQRKFRYTLVKYLRYFLNYNITLDPKKRGRPSKKIK